MTVSVSPMTPKAYKLLQDSILTLSQIEHTGIRIDTDYCEKQIVHMNRTVDRLQKKLEEDAVVKTWRKQYGLKTNLDSGHQLADILFNVLQIEPSKVTAKGAAAVDKEALESLDVPVVKNLLQIRKLKKARDTYLLGILRETVDGYLHPFFSLHNVLSFRGSSQSPNFQNIPIRDEEIKKIVRRAFIPRDGHIFGGLDFGSMEVRISACVVGQTKIRTIDGHQTILQVIERVRNGEKVYVYGYDKKKKRIAISQVTDGGITGKKVEVWKVTLDNGEVLILTPNHEVLLRDEEYTSVRSLKVGDSIMPFYEKTTKDKSSGVSYVDIYLNNGNSIREHNLIAEDVLGTVIKGSGLVVHHKNSNGTCNSIHNLEIMDRKQHMKIHSIQGWKNKPNRENVFRDKKFQEENKKRVQERFANMTEEQKYEYGRRISDSIRVRGGMGGSNNPMHGKKHSELTKEKISKAKKGVKLGTSWNSGLTKEQHPGLMSISTKNKGRVSKYRGVRRRHVISEETKKKLSEAGKGRIFSVESKKRISENKKKYWESVRTSGKTTTCAICGKSFKVITNTHLLSHNITPAEYKDTYNHKVVSVEFHGYEDVYNINVEGFHNYAVSAGIVIKNCYHKDPNMLRYIKDPTTDMHRDVSMDCFILNSPDLVHKAVRQTSKGAFTFAQLYGDYYKNCAKNLWGAIDSQNLIVNDSNKTPMKEHLSKHGVKNYEAFEEHIRRVEDKFWNERFAVYTQWKKDWVKAYEKNGYIELHTGFRCTGLMGKNDVLNYQIQGAAFHCLLWSMCRIHQWLKDNNLKTRIVGQIHDEIVLDMHEDEIELVLSKCRQVMTEDIIEDFTWICVPLEVDAAFCEPGGSWYGKKNLPMPKETYSFYDNAFFNENYKSSYALCKEQ